MARAKLTRKRRKAAPDVSFPWAGPTSGDQRRVEMYFDADPGFSAEMVRELEDGADHAHDEDVLQAVITNFAERHGYGVRTFATGPSLEDPPPRTLTIELIKVGPKP